MQRIVKPFAVMMLILFVMGCSPHTKNIKPKWLYEPKANQAVGFCGAHALGKHKQRECAISRARIELAARHGVSVQSMSVMEEYASGQSASSQLEQTTTQQVNAQVKARVVKSYYDAAQDRLWILLEED